MDKFAHIPDDRFTLPPIYDYQEAEHLNLAGEVNWGHTAMKVHKFREACGDLKIKCGVVDTGIDYDHPKLANCFAHKDFTGSSRGSKDVHGHGTHCSGTVAGMDPEIGVASGFPICHGKGLGDQGSGGSGLYRAIEWCLEQGAEVVSNSWGGGSLDQQTDAMFKRIAELPERPWLIFAGGNSGPGTPNTDAPGVSMHVINVAALGPDLRVASFSSRGDKIDTSGPGVDIWSYKPGGTFARMSGTSMATPWIAGLLTLFRAGLKKAGKQIPTIYELRKLLFERSTDTMAPGDDRDTGPGWATPDLLLNYLKASPPVAQ